MALLKSLLIKQSSTNRPRSVKCVAEKSSLQGVGNQCASEGGKYVGHILKFLGPILNYVP